MTLYKCRPEDLNELISIVREIYQETFHPMNSPETMEMSLKDAYCRKKIL